MCVVCPIVFGIAAIVTVAKSRKGKNMKAKYGWYSQKQFDLNGGVTYLNEAGQEVLVTQVTISDKTNSTWDDIKYVGVVTKFVRDNGRMRQSELIEQ